MHDRSAYKMPSVDMSDPWKANIKGVHCQCHSMPCDRVRHEWYSQMIDGIWSMEAASGLLSSAPEDPQPLDVRMETVLVTVRVCYRHPSRHQTVNRSTSLRSFAFATYQYRQPCASKRLITK
jgi:hypothetical protein